MHRTPNRGGPYLTASTARTVEQTGSPRFRRICFLAAPPGPGTARNEKISTVGCSGLDSQLLGTILRPFPTIFVDLGRATQLTPWQGAILFFLVFQQLATGLCPLEPHRDSGLGGAIGLKSYLTVVEIWPF